MDFLNKLKDKKAPMSENYKKAKMSTLQSLRDEMSGMMKDDLTSAKGMKTVEVAGSDPEALETGLDTAKEMVTGEEPSAPEMVEELVESENLTPESIDEIIKMLEQKKMEMTSGEMTPALDKMTGQEE